MSNSAITGPVFTDVRRSPSGSAAAPSWSFADATGTGVYLASTDVLALSTAGVQRVVVDASGNVGIGTDSPTSKLTVVDSVCAIESADTNGYPRISGTNSNAQLGLFRSGTSAGGGYIGANDAASFMVLDSSFTELMRVHPYGKIENRAGLPIVTGGANALTAAFDVTQTTIPYGGYGTALHWQSVTPGGYRQHASLGSWRPASSGWGSVFLAVGQEDNALTRFYLFSSEGAAWQANNSSTWSTTSDVRIKQNIRPVNNCLNKITALNPVHFEYIHRPEQIKTGFIAQEFEQILPGHVSEEGCPPEIFEIKPELKDEKIKGIDPDLIPYLVGAIKELKAELDEAKAKIAALESK